MPNRQILLGDFNYSYASHLSTTPPRQAPSSWLHYIDNHYLDGVTPSDHPSEATFHNSRSRSCIDYIFVSHDLIDCKVSSSTTFVQPAWTDHTLVSLRLHLSSPVSTSSAPSPRVGKGIWRAHPRLALSKDFREQLSIGISSALASFPSTMSAQDKWDSLKIITTSLAKKFSRKQSSHLKSVEKILQGKRNSINQSIRRYPSNAPSLTPQLFVIESQLSSIQQYHAETLALRSGLRWREMGEISAGYLKRTIAHRQSRQLITTLSHPFTNTTCSSTTEMQNAAIAFYADLYSPDPIDDHAVNDLLDSLPNSLRLTAIDSSYVSSPILWDDLTEGVRRCPSKSIPGLDGIPYEILRLLFFHPECKELILQVYNDALSSSVFPKTWSNTCVSLLPKKRRFIEPQELATNLAHKHRCQSVHAHPQHSYHRVCGCLGITVSNRLCPGAFHC